MLAFHVWINPHLNTSYREVKVTRRLFTLTNRTVQGIMLSAKWDVLARVDCCPLSKRWLFVPCVVS